MAAISNADKKTVARIWARKVYSEGNATATLSSSDIEAAVQAIDDAFEGLPTALPNQASSVALNINAVLPSPFTTEADASQKGLLVGLWASVKYGAI